MNCNHCEFFTLKKKPFQLLCEHSRWDGAGAVILDGKPAALKAVANSNVKRPAWCPVDIEERNKK